MEIYEIINELNLLGIYTHKQLIEEELKYWWQIQYKFFKNEEDKLYMLNEAMGKLNNYKNDELIEILKLTNSNNIENKINIEDEKQNSETLNENASDYEVLKENVIDNIIKFCNEGDYENAINESNLLINFCPEEDFFYFLRAYSKLRSPQVYKNNSIINDVDLAIKYGPSDSKNYTLKAEIILDIVKNSSENYRYTLEEDFEKTKDARNYCDYAIKLDRENINAYFIRGIIQTYLENFDEANKDFFVAIKLSELKDNELNTIHFSSNSTSRSLSLGLSYVGAKEFEKILSGLIYRTLFQYKKDLSTCSPKLEMIKKNLDFAIKLDKENIDAYANRGFIKNLLGDRKEALKDLEIVNELDPDDEKDYKLQIEEVTKPLKTFFKNLNW